MDEKTVTEITEDVTAETIAEVKTMAAAIAVLVEENNGAFPGDTEKAMLRFSEIAPSLVRESRLFDVFLACGGSDDLFAVKETSEKEQRAAVEAVVNGMHLEYWIDREAAESVCRDFLAAIGAKITEAEESLCSQADRYYSGDGVAQDKTKAAELYEEAAVNGDAVAQYTLGYMFDKGDGVEKDRAKAMVWYEKAAAQGHEAAANRYGVMRRVQPSGKPVKPVFDKTEEEAPKKKKFFGR